MPKPEDQKPSDDNLKPDEEKTGHEEGEDVVEETTQKPSSDQEEIKPEEGETPIDWEKRYKDSQRELNKKFRPSLEKANYVAQLTGYDNTDELYDAIRANELIKPDEIEKKDVASIQKDSSKTKKKEQEPKKESTELEKKVAVLDKDRQSRQKRDIDGQFDSFYQDFPDAKEREAELIAIATPLWKNARDGKKYRYDTLKDALTDAYVILDKESFMDKGKLEALKKMRINRDATQSVLGDGSTKKESTAKTTLSQEQKRTAQKFMQKGIFKSEQEYAEYIAKSS